MIRAAIIIAVIGPALAFAAYDHNLPVRENESFEMDAHRGEGVPAPIPRDRYVTARDLPALVNRRADPAKLGQVCGAGRCVDVVQVERVEPSPVANDAPPAKAAPPSKPQQKMISPALLEHMRMRTSAN